MVRLLIFDVDGTLVDSQHDIVEAQARAFAAFGLQPPSRERALSVVGLSLAEAFESLAGPDAPIEGLADAYKAAWTDLRLQPGWRDTLYPGAAETIAGFASGSDVLLGLATGKSRRGVDRLIEAQNWHHIFATIQTADGHPSKPDPSMILAAMAESGTAPEHTVMIGDTTYDIEMAAAACARSIGVAWGYHPPADLVSAGATTIVETFDELSAVLREFIRETTAHDA